MEFVAEKREAAEIIQQLIDLAKKMRDEQQRGTKLNLTEEEIAFYDTLADNESAKQVLGDETLQKMAKELVETVRKNVRIDWTIRESVQARLRVLVKRLLKKIQISSRQTTESNGHSPRTSKTPMRRLGRDTSN